MVKKNKYDRKTKSLIKKLSLLHKQNKLTEVDTMQLKKIINGEVDYNQILKEKNKCKEDVFYFINEYVYVKNKFESEDEIPQILKDRIQNDKIKFVLYDIQKDLINAILNNNRVISVKSRQIGFTTTVLALMLHVISFQHNKNILLFSKSEEDAKSTLAEQKFMYYNLPFFLRRKERKNNEKSLALGSNTNSSEIKVQTSGKKSGRSHAATYLILDEADYIDNIEDIQRAAQFTLAATNGKAIVLSTPNMFGSWFYKMVQGAREGKNNFVLIEGHWRSIPQRDDKQYQLQCESLNQDKNSIKTELNMEWILPYELYFNEDKLKSIKSLKEKDFICGMVKQYYDKNKTDNYLITVDCQEEGTHKNAICVYNLNKKRIEATLKTRANVYEILLDLVNYYKNEKTKELAKILIERNRGFYLIKKFEENGLSHLLLPNIRYNRKKDIFEFDLDKDGKPNKLGLVTTETTRQRGLSLLSRLIHKSKELPEDLIEEAKNFVIKKGKPVGLKDDDLILAVSFALLTEYTFNNIIKGKDNKSKMYKKILKEYYNTVNFMGVEEKLRQQKYKLKKKLKDIKTKNSKFLLAHELNLNKAQSLIELEMLEKIANKKHKSKIGKAFSILI